jgi:hypothetical protein
MTRINVLCIAAAMSLCACGRRQASEEGDIVAPKQAQQAQQETTGEPSRQGVPQKRPSVPERRERFVLEQDSHELGIPQDVYVDTWTGCRYLRSTWNGQMTELIAADRRPDCDGEKQDAPAGAKRPGPSDDEP